MAEKTTKKPVAKKATTKKTVSKPAVAKKPTAKKTATKKVQEIKAVASAPVVEKHACGCGHDCACGGECACAKKKCTFGRFLKKVVLFLIIFAMGFATAKMCCSKKFGKMGPRPEFDNGCLVVKCPKMAEKIAMMDANQDGCVSPEEFKAARKMMKHRPEMPAEQPVEQPAPVPAPEMAE